MMHVRKQRTATTTTPSDLSHVLTGIEAVCFDAFGTLVEITDKRGAYLPLLKALPKVKRLQLKQRLMREDRAVNDWPHLLDAEVASDIIDQVQLSVELEVSSVALRPGMANIWIRLRTSGLRLAVCSNLASSYGPVVRQSLPDRPDVEVFSYKVGAIKPEPAIYQHVLDGLQLDPAKVLFVGDTVQADVTGPRAVGMAALHVTEFERCL